VNRELAKWEGNGMYHLLLPPDANLHDVLERVGHKMDSHFLPQLNVGDRDLVSID